MRRKLRNSAPNISLSDFILFYLNCLSCPCPQLSIVLVCLSDFGACVFHSLTVYRFFFFLVETNWLFSLVIDLLTFFSHVHTTLSFLQLTTLYPFLSIYQFMVTYSLLILIKSNWTVHILFLILSCVWSCFHTHHVFRFVQIDFKSVSLTFSFQFTCHLY